MPTQQTDSKGSNSLFKWTDLCQLAFGMLKDKLCHEPILKYPDTSKLYTLKLDVMKDIYHLVMYNIKLARERMIKNQGLVSKLDINISDLGVV